MCVDRRVRGCGVCCPHRGCAVCVLTGVHVAVVFAVLTVAVVCVCVDRRVRGCGVCCPHRGCGVCVC